MRLTDDWFAVKASTVDIKPVNALLSKYVMAQLMFTYVNIWIRA